ncbi:MAG: MFS transporter [Pseudarthrobacter sp.]|nr:MFS transporter [Pseudarthrobacter sp.]
MMTARAQGVGFRSERGPILIALMLSTGLVAIDSTIVATAVPSIVHDIGGFSNFPWLFSAYLLAQAVSVPIYGKLSDMAGRKPIILTGIGLFLLGSVLCGVAWSMPSLIAFRALQGLGAGAVLPVSITIAGDIYSLEERAKVQGYLASVWAISSVVGPSLGGIFSALGIWRGIFLVNVPLCLLAGWMLVRTLHENVERATHKVDYAGAVLLAGSLGLLILGALQGGQAWAWNSPLSCGIFIVGVVLLAAFLLVERRAAEPILPSWVVSRRLLATTALVSFGVGAVMIGLTSCVPTFLEGALASSPLVAGLALAALTLGWPLSASQAGKFYLRIGFKATALIGVAIAVAGLLILSLTAGAPNVVLIAITCFVVGLGLGLLATPTLISAQSSVPWHERGVVTSTNMFARSIGSALGVAVFGAVANSIYGGAGGNGNPSAVVAASSAVFLASLIAGLLTVAAVLAMPAVHAGTMDRAGEPGQAGEAAAEAPKPRSSR